MTMRKTQSSLNLLKGKDLSLQNLTKLNKQLESQQNRVSQNNKEMKNQISIARKNDVAISRNIMRINQQGEELASRYQEQKEKYEKLQYLVKNIEEEIYRSKMDKANDLKNNIQTDKLVEYGQSLGDREKELEKILEKVNTSSYDLSKKVDNIRGLRSERTIVSSLFDKIERQLCNLEHCYKVLVIERKREEDVLGQAVEEFNHCEHSAAKEIAKIKDKNEKLKEKQMKIRINAKINTQLGDLNEERRLSKANGFLLDVVTKSYQSTTEIIREKEKSKDKAFKLDCDLAKVKRERAVKNVFNYLGINSVKELPEKMEQLESQNEELLKESDRLFEQLLKEEEKHQALKHLRRLGSGPGVKTKRLARKKHTFCQVQNEIGQNKLQLQEFGNVIKIVFGRIQETHPFLFEPLPEAFMSEEEEIVYYMGQLQQFFENSYIKQEPIIHSPREQTQPKFLNNFLTTRDEHNMSIYEEQDLLQFAKRNLEKLDKTDRGQGKN